MATRLEQGQAQLRSAAGVPMERVTPQQVEFVGPRAEARTNEILAQNVDRMTQGILEHGRGVREREAVQFVIDTPPTAEQMLAAREGDVSTLVASDFPSAFNQAVKKRRSFQISERFGAQIRDDIVGIANQAEQGLITPVEAKEAIDNRRKGFTASIAKFDGDAALRFDANAAADGHVAYKTALDAAVKKTKETDLIIFRRDTANKIEVYKKALATNPNLGPEYENLFKDAILKAASLHGPVIYKEFQEIVETKFIEAQVNVVSKHLLKEEYMSDAEATLKNIRDLTIGDMSTILQHLDIVSPDSIRKITANFITANNQRDAIATRKREAVKLAGQNASIELLEQILPLAKNNPKRAGLVEQLLELPPGSTSTADLKNILAPEKEGDGNLLAEYNALGLIFDDIITSKEQIDRIPGLNTRQRLTLLKALRTENRDGLRTLDAGLNKLSGIREEPGIVISLDKNSEELKRKQELRVRVEEIKLEAANEGKVLTERQILDKLESQILEKRNTAGAKQAQTKLDNYVRNPDGTAKKGRGWITGPITSRSIDALRRQAGNDREKLRQVKDMEALLKQAQGN